MTEQTYDVTAYQNGFRANLRNTPEQMKSRLIGAVVSNLNHTEPGTSFNVDIVDEDEMPDETVSKMAVLKPREIGEKRRGGFFRPIEKHFHVDTFDKVRLAADPTDRKMNSMMAKKEQKRDLDIIDIGFGTAYETNEQGLLVNAVAFPASQIIAADDRTNLHDLEKNLYGSSGDIGLTVGKLITAKGRLNQSEIDGEDDHFATTTDGLNHLLASTAVGSSDYNQVKALIDGRVNTFMGFTFHRFEKMPVNNSIVDDMAWRKSAIEYRERALLDENVNISRRTDLGGLPWQFYYKLERAGVRVFDKGVLKVQRTQTRGLAA